MSRRAAGEGTVYCRADGVWTSAVELPREGGRRRRRVLYGKTRGEVARKVRELQDRLDHE